MPRHESLQLLSLKYLVVNTTTDVALYCFVVALLIYWLPFFSFMSEFSTFCNDTDNLSFLFCSWTEVQFFLTNIKEGLGKEKVLFDVIGYFHSMPRALIVFIKYVLNFMKSDPPKSGPYRIYRSNWGFL